VVLLVISNPFKTFLVILFILALGQNTCSEEKLQSVIKKEKPQVLLAYNWEPSVDIKGWWISEKLDGVRGYWTGEKMISKSGNAINAPAWFTKQFPPFVLDGELWLGRGLFNELNGIVRSKNAEEKWKKVRYYIFDVPQDSVGFEKRLEKARNWFEAKPSLYATVLEQRLCKGLEHLYNELAETEKKGGEGLMLRRPGSLYKNGRSRDILKVKTFHDSEAVVINHTAGKGKYSGKMGAILVELPNGIRFSIGSGFSDKERENPPAIGSTITFKYKEFNKSGVPRFATFLRVREKL
jgi:DNA ligase-1